MSILVKLAQDFGVQCRFHESSTGFGSITEQYEFHGHSRHDGHSLKRRGPFSWLLERCHQVDDGTRLTLPLPNCSYNLGGEEIECPAEQ